MSQAHADFAGELGVRARHEGGHLFMADLHEVDQVLMAVERPHDAVDSVAGVSEQPFDTPLGQPVTRKSLTVCAMVTPRAGFQFENCAQLEFRVMA
jgi:hypothetical protein